MPQGESFALRLVLASGPLVLVLACSVYDDALLGSSAPAGGSSSGGAGMPPGGTSSQSGGSDAGGGTKGGQTGSAGETNGASAGSAGASSSGSDAGGAAGAAGNTTAGADAGGQATRNGSVVDDMEDTDAQITVHDGRNGFWYVGNDETAGGMQTPASSMFEMFELSRGERGDSTYSVHMKVSGFTGWGSVIGFNVVEQQAAVKAYDASQFCALEFWGRAAAATSLRLRLPDGDTHPSGMVCQLTGAADTLCYDHFSAAVALTTGWKSFRVAFASLEQIGTGYHPADKKFKADQLYAVEWALPGASGKAFEIWIDDVAFIECP